MSEFTTVVGVDANTKKFLDVTLPNWRVYRPEMFERPFILFFDGSQIPPPYDLHNMIGKNCRLVDWRPEGTFKSQRHKMLAGHIALPAVSVETKWWLKVDCDAFAVCKKQWFKPEWFKEDWDWIASSWPYTKPAKQVLELEAWGNKAMPEFPPLGYDPPPEKNSFRHNRMASWVMFGQVEYAKWAFNLYDGFVPPIESQDGYHFYVTKRAGRPYKRLGMKKFGWRNRTSYKNVVAQVRDIGTGGT